MIPAMDSCCATSLSLSRMAAAAGRDDAARSTPNGTSIPACDWLQITPRLSAAIRNVVNVTVYDLSAAYPDRRVDAIREQELLRDHDAIVWQFPWHWYSVPGVLKEWMDQVLT
jgi:hypothetical protein